VVAVVAHIPELQDQADQVAVEREQCKMQRPLLQRLTQDQVVVAVVPHQVRADPVQ
jgi:hypothetical protein